MYEGLSSRAIIGGYYATLEQSTGVDWIGALTMLMDSDQASETYNWLGQVPVMREWIGARLAVPMRENGITIINRHYEATLQIPVIWAKRDKTRQIEVRTGEFVDRSQSHWASLCSALILAGASTVCYDSQYFFDTDHAEGSSGSQSNKISVDISAVPATLHGTTTDPSIEELRAAIIEGISAMYGFVDDQGEPINETAREFVVMVPTKWLMKANAAVAAPLVGGDTNFLPANVSNIRVRVVANARLNTWTTQLVVFRADGRVKPIIRQTEQDVELLVQAEGSLPEFNHKEWWFGIDAWRGAGFGMWQGAVMITLT